MRRLLLIRTLDLGGTRELNCRYQRIVAGRLFCKLEPSLSTHSLAYLMIPAFTHACVQTQNLAFASKRSTGTDRR